MFPRSDPQWRVLRPCLRLNGLSKYARPIFSRRGFWRIREDQVPEVQAVEPRACSALALMVASVACVGVPVPSGRGRLRRSGPPRPGTGSAGRARQGRCKPRATDPLLPKPDRAGAPPAETMNSSGRGHGGIVRGCPLGTGQDCCEWHASGTAGEGHSAGRDAVGSTLTLG